MAVGRARLGVSGTRFGAAQAVERTERVGLFGGRHAVFYDITSRGSAHPEDFKSDMVTLFELLRDRAIHPVVIDRLPLAAAPRSTSASMPADLAVRSCLYPGPGA